LKNDWNYEVKLLDRAKFYYLIFRQPFGCRFFDEKIATAQMAHIEPFTLLITPYTKTT
jgi:hypothetical protein